MKRTNYSILMKNLKANDEQELLRIINERIDKIILKESEPKKYVLQALICEFEKGNNDSLYICIISIVYAMLIMLFSLVGNVVSTEGKTFLIGVAIVCTTVLLVVARVVRRMSIDRTFILTALKFKYKEVEHQNDEYEEIETEKNQMDINKDEGVYIVKVEKK